MLAAKVGGLYDSDELVIEHSTLNELPRLVNLTAMSTLLFWLARHYLVDRRSEDRAPADPLVAADGRAGRGPLSARELARRLAPIERCLLVGRRSVSGSSRRSSPSYPRVTLVGRRRDRGDRRPTTVRLREIAERDHIHRIIIDTDAASPAATLGIVRAANATGLQVSLLPSMLAAVGGSVVFDDVGGLVLMGVPRFGLTRSSQALKRDVRPGRRGRSVLLLPPADGRLALAVKLDSPGPVLFRQTARRARRRSRFRCSSSAA